MPLKGTERTVKMQITATDWLHSLPVLLVRRRAADSIFAYHERGDLNLWSVPSAGGVATTADATSAARCARSRPPTKATRSSTCAPARSNGSEAHYLPAIGGPPRRLTQLRRNVGRRARAAGDCVSIVRRPLHPGLPVPPAQHARGREVSRARAGARRRHELIPPHAEPARALPRLEGLRRDGDQLSRRIRLRPRVPGSRRQRLGERPGARRGDRRRFHAIAAVRERQGRHLRLQLRRHHDDGDDRAAIRTSTTRRCRWPASTTSAMR